MLRFVNLKLGLVLLPALFIVATPLADSERFVASLPQFRNWGLENKINNNSHIHAPEAWKHTEGSHDIIVAVIDTGIDPNHPDLKNNLWRDLKTRFYGWDFVANKPNPQDDHGHGTHVAGILGANLNLKAGVSGVAHKVSIMAVKYYSEKNTGTQNLENSIKALNWAIDHGAKIINYSGGGPEFSGSEFQAIKRAREKNILIVAAAGNERHNSDLVENYYYPCSYRLDNIICVSATNIRNEMLPSSNWGKNHVDFAAPGEGILSTVPNGKYAYMSGTSQATAFVSGLASLMLAKDRTLKPAQIREILRSSVDKLPSLEGKVFTGGKVNAAKALATVSNLSTARATALDRPARATALDRPAHATALDRTARATTLDSTARATTLDSTARATTLDTHTLSGTQKTIKTDSLKKKKI